MRCSLAWSLALLALAACGGTVTNAPADAGVDATCAPAPCPSSARWNDVTCRCEAPDAGPPSIRASDYDQHCATAADCVPIFEGLLCGCGCPNAAINRSDQARERADAQRLYATCPVDDRPQCGACAGSRVLCTNAKCAVESCNADPCPPEDAGADAAHD